MYLETFVNNITTINKKPIPLDLELVKELKMEHELIEQQLNNIENAVYVKNYELLSGYVGEFGATLRSHLAKENTKFYMRLQYILPKNSAQFEIMKKFKNEMTEISKVVNKFIFKYYSCKINEKNQAAYLEELNCVMALLERRILNEESKLFPLYEDPDNEDYYEQLICFEQSVGVR